MILIERVMAAVAAFLACDLFGLDSCDVERARRERDGAAAAAPRGLPGDGRHVAVRFGR